AAIDDGGVRVNTQQTGVVILEPEPQAQASACLSKRCANAGWHLNRWCTHGLDHGVSSDRPVTIRQQERPRLLSQWHDPLRAGEGSSQWHETAVDRRSALQVVVVPLKGDRLLDLAEAQGQDEPATQAQLVEPRRSDVRRAGRENDAIVGCAPGISIASIGTAHVDAI